MKRTSHQALPANGPERKALQEKGQFWTPEWVSRAMAKYVLSGGARRVFDPAVGAGALLASARRVSETHIAVGGFEIYSEVLELAKKEGLTERDLEDVRLQDYLAPSETATEQAIICNPPYIRHHKLDNRIKRGVRSKLEHWLGVPLDGRLGLHGYFLLRSLQQLGRGGRLAYITSADLYEGKSARAMWTAIASRFRIDAIVTFESEATPFPTVDTNPVICLIAAEPPTAHYRYVRVVRAETESLEVVVGQLCQPAGTRVTRDVWFQEREVRDYLAFGLARPRLADSRLTLPLGHFIKCMRGIATGANHFFFLTEEEILKRKLPKEFFMRAVGRTRDVSAEEITSKTLGSLDRAGRPTWLLNLRGFSRERLPLVLRNYLSEGEELGLVERPLIKQRDRWYWTEQRTTPPFFFAYLGRRNVRFIRNRAGVQALTGFLYVYPQPSFSSPKAVETLWEGMRTPEFLSNLDLVAKTYGGGALKVEPRALERTPIPLDVVKPLLKLSSVRSEIQLVEKTLVSRS